MQRKQRPVSTAGMLTFWFVLLNVLVLRQGLTTNPDWYKLAVVTLPLLLLCLLNLRGKTQ
jgi:uncharacterized membrane protein YhdT